VSAPAAAPGKLAPAGAAETLLVIAVLGVVSIMIVPLPAVVLDLLLAFNVAMSVLMLLIALSLTRPLDFSVFPALLLITTLFRLGLNVATTRLILLRGAEGPGAAGHLIEAFGRFAVGGSLIVGAVVFLILLVVNFAVITKGSGRVSEVAARFTLDALPGKQMSIDADLAAGVIDDRGAKERRATLEAETEFFGAMDGASKFVRGDAVAGLAITGINIVGGLLAGLARDHLSLAQASETYTLLTVGDGLVSQIPALLVSTAAGIVVTRAGAGARLGAQVGAQVFGNVRVLQSASGVFVAFALIPGMPSLVFLGLAAGAQALAARAKQAAKAPVVKPREDAQAPERLADLLLMDVLELQVGYALLPMLEVAKGGELPGRITALRKQLATDLGVVLPSLHLRDNLRLEPNEYKVLLRGHEVGKGTAYPDRQMAIAPSGGAPALDGIAAQEPAFGLPARWITEAQRPAAEALGLTLVDPASVVTTHLSELLRKLAHELVGRQEAQELLAACAKESPKLVEDMVPGTLTLAELVRVLRGLLREGVSVRDLRTILEAIADAAPRSKDTIYLVEQVRRRLARQLTTRVMDATGRVHVLTLERQTEELLRASLASSEGEAVLSPDLETAQKLLKSLETRAGALAAQGLPTVLLAPPDLRRPLFEFASRFVSDLWVITARELVPGTPIEPVGLVQLPARGHA
jgi:flagellar biosynthesis protein FlhA